jgi:prepilin-type N-terminal cleavage/methylation domain-containing protein/prepilin-type processing-associated H-X9-DG protein
MAVSPRLPRSPRNVSVGFTPGKSSGRSSSAAFTLIELLVVIAIIAILAAILFPVFAQAREKARQASCQSNQKQIGIAVIQYYQDYDGAYPPRYIDYDTTGTVRMQWTSLLFPYIKQKGGAQGTTDYAEGVWNCPSNIATSSTSRNPSYAMVCDAAWQYPFNSASPNSNWKGYVYHGADSSLYDPMVEAPADSLLIGETTGGWHRICPSNNLPAGTPAATASTAHYNTPGWTSHYAVNTNNSDIRHTGGANYIFFDGHVKWLKPAQTLAPKNMWTLYDRD